MFFQETFSTIKFYFPPSNNLYFTPVLYRYEIEVENSEVIITRAYRALKAELRFDSFSTSRGLETGARGFPAAATAAGADSGELMVPRRYHHWHLILESFWPELCQDPPPA